MVKTKSVHDKIEKPDGTRILAKRFKGMFLRKSIYNIWMANLGPSELLLKDFQNDKINWYEFSKKYKEELLGLNEKDTPNKTIKNRGQKFTLRLIKHLAKKQPITLMCHCDTGSKECHLRILKELINKA